jgi:TetR/AcrR family transcriptional repressor of nem operon
MGKLQVRERIVAAAVERFHARGYGACDVQEIITAAGVPEEAFVEHFGQKELLAIEVLEIYWDKIRMEMLLEPGVAPIERLRTHFEHIETLYIGLGLELGCLIGKFAQELVDAPPMIQKDVEDAITRWVGLVSRVVREGQKDGSITATLDADQLARFLINSWGGAATCMKLLKSRAPLADFFSITFSAVIRP